MQHITNINFNFEALEDVIIEKLKEYNICRDGYFGGSETTETLKGKIDALVSAIDCCDGCIMIRKAVINKKLLEKKGGECEEISKDNLISENKYLLGQLDWHKKIKNGVLKSYNKLVNAEFGYEEPDNN